MRLRKERSIIEANTATLNSKVERSKSRNIKYKERALIDREYDNYTNSVVNFNTQKTTDQGSMVNSFPEVKINTVSIIR